MNIDEVFQLYTLYQQLGFWVGCIIGLIIVLGSSMCIAWFSEKLDRIRRVRYSYFQRDIDAGLIDPVTGEFIES